MEPEPRELDFGGELNSKLPPLSADGTRTKQDRGWRRIGLPRQRLAEAFVQILTWNKLVGQMTEHMAGANRELTDTNAYETTMGRAVS